MDARIKPGHDGGSQRAMPPLTMHTMLLDAAGKPLRLAELPVPAPGPNQILIKVAACGVCRTDLHIVDGELPSPSCRSIPATRSWAGWRALGRGVEDFAVGDRVGVPWLGHTCGTCFYCRRGRRESLR